ncbi:MAG: OmpH family outer membrane protein [Bacteroidetes bacterium]|nr:OmpH family outer membrane protein [Bacteroidota bacterium]
MKNKFVLALLALLLTGMGAMAQTAATPNQVKIGYASVNYILSQMPDYKQIEKQLVEYEKQLSTQLQTQYQEFQTKMDTYQKTSGTMLPEIRQQKEGELRDMQTRIEQFQRDAQGLIQKKESDLLAPAYDKIQNNIDAVAKENNFTHVLNSEVAGVPALLYVSDESNDISNLVLKKMGITPKEATTTQK